jgi:hypothetical protein
VVLKRVVEVHAERFEVVGEAGGRRREAVVRQPSDQLAQPANASFVELASSSVDQ